MTRVPTCYIDHGGPFYDYRGFCFEWHHYSGPWPVRRDNFDPRKTLPPGFWPAMDEFGKLSPEEKVQYECK